MMRSLTQQLHDSCALCRSLEAEDRFSWMKLFLLAWAAKHNITEIAMNQLVRALEMLFALLCSLALKDTIASGANMAAQKKWGSWPSRFANLKPSAENESDSDSEEEWNLEEPDRDPAVKLVRRKQFVRYAMCPDQACGKLYTLEEACTLEDAACTRLLTQPVERPADADYPAFEDSRRKDQSRCGEILLRPKNLLKRIAHKIRERVQYSRLPVLLFPYRGIQRYLRCFFRRPGFEEDLEKWRTVQPVDGLYRDIFDGTAWKDYQWYEEEPLLANPYVLALGLNIDWLQPHTHTANSVGAIFVCILNLPRAERFLTKNTMLVGLLPGPRKTSRTQLQSALKPFVAELNQLWDGIRLRTALHPEGRRIRAFLMMVVNDVPAARETCGFGGVNSCFGCTVCRRAFSQRVGVKFVDTSGIDRENWKRRTDESHRADALRWAAAANESQREDIFKNQGGSRFCELMNAPAFNCVEGVVIDVMHNIFLGLGKRLMEELCHPRPVRPVAEGASSTQSSAGAASSVLLRSIISEDDLVFLQRWIDRCLAPRSVGRIPGKIQSGFGSLTAVEWSNWMAIFAVPALRDLLLFKDQRLLEARNKVNAVLKANKSLFRPTPEALKQAAARLAAAESAASVALHSASGLLAAMPLFVEAQRAANLVREYTFTEEQLQELDESLMRILHRVQLQFGANAVTPNMHLSTHLREFIRRYGPPAGWWCFATERANGMLGRFPANQAFVEVSMMYRWVLQSRLEQQVAALDRGEALMAGCTPPMRDLLHEISFGRRNEVDLDEEDEMVQFTKHSKAGFTRYQYVWKSAAAFETFRGYSTDPDVYNTLTAAEAIPGAFRGDGTNYDLERWLREEKDKNIVPLLKPRYLEYRQDVHAGHVLHALMRFYALSYVKDLPLPPAVQTAWDKQKNGIDAKLLMDHLPRLDTNIRLFSTLDMAGEVFGSRAAPRGESNSFVAVLFDVLKTHKAEYWYGQIQFFMEHKFASADGKPERTHRFAYIKWLDHWDASATPSLRAKELINQDLPGGICAAGLARAKRWKQPKTGPGAGTQEERPTIEEPWLHQSVVMSTLADHDRFPYLSSRFTGPDLQELIPVHRLAFKFFPHIDVAKNRYVACPIPSATHA